MRHTLYTVLGAALCALVSYGLVELFALWYGPRYIRSDTDIGNAFMAALGFMLVCLIAGGIAGYRWAGRHPRTEKPPAAAANARH